MADKTKVESSHNVEFAKGGDTHMFGTGDRTTVAPQDAASEQVPGQTASKSQGGKQKYAEGGKTKMFGFSPAVDQQAGRTSQR